MHWTVSPFRMSAVFVVEYVDDILSRFIDDYVSDCDTVDTSALPILSEVAVDDKPNGYILRTVCADIDDNVTLFDTTEMYLRHQLHEQTLSRRIDVGSRLILIDDTNHLSFDFYKKKGFTFDARLFKSTHCCFFKVIK
jgi:hypothetical protein